MTKQECKDKIDSIVGLKSDLVQSGTEYKLQYRSPAIISSTGTLLFEINIFDNHGSWQFDTVSSALPGMWKELCNATR